MAFFPSNIIKLEPKPSLIVIKSISGSITSQDSFGGFVSLKSAVTSWAGSSKPNSVTLTFNKIPKEATVIIEFFGQTVGTITSLSDAVGTNCEVSMDHISVGSMNNVTGYFKVTNITNNDITITATVVGYAAIVGINVVVV